MDYTGCFPDMQRTAALPDRKAAIRSRVPAMRWEMLRPAFYSLIILWINAYVCRALFFASTTYMGSMHGFWTALATHAGGSWFHATWWPFSDNGIPFESTYPPLVPALAAAVAALRGVTPAVGFHSVTGLFYIRD